MTSRKDDCASLSKLTFREKELIRRLRRFSEKDADDILLFVVEKALKNIEKNRQNKKLPFG